MVTGPTHRSAIPSYSSGCAASHSAQARSASSGVIFSSSASVNGSAVMEPYSASLARTSVCRNCRDSPKATRVPIVSAATIRYVTTTANSVRPAIAETATPIPAIMPNSTRIITSPTSTAHGDTRPTTAATASHGSAAARNAAEAIHAASHLPAIRCPVRSRVTWVMARVPPARSPEIALAARAGETSSERVRTKSRTPSKSVRPRARICCSASSGSRPDASISVMPRLRSPRAPRVTAPTTTKKTPNSTYQPRERSR